jgi:hypothetical protein
MDDMDILKKTYSINLFEIFSKRIKNKKNWDWRDSSDLCSLFIIQTRFVGWVT